MFCASRGDKCWYDPESATAFLRAFCHSRHLLLVRGLCRGDGNSLRPIDLFVAHKRRLRAVPASFLWRVAGNHAFCGWSGGLADGTECCCCANSS